MLKGIFGIVAVVLFGASALATEYDFDGDGKSDIAFARNVNGISYIFNSSREDFGAASAGGIQRLSLGNSKQHIPVTGDFDGDGIWDSAYRDIDSALWVIRYSSSGARVSLTFGRGAADIPVPADYDGDGITDLAVRRPSNGTWYIFNSTGVDTISGNADGITRHRFGNRTDDIPVPADYDGDGKADLAIRRVENHTWYIRNSSGVDAVTDNADGITRRRFGLGTHDIPVPADYDGDGKADIAVRRPSSYFWYVLNSGGVDPVSGHSDGISRVQFGRHEQDIPVLGDFDGDGRSDFAVRRASNHHWYVLNSAGQDTLKGSSGRISRLRFGLADGDIPLTQPAWLLFYSFDYDGDGLTYAEEMALGTDFQNPDTDGDGVVDGDDEYPSGGPNSADSDGDGINDDVDAFPNDPDESVDSDGDGIGDNGDAYPTDSVCSAASDGDGETCYLRLLYSEIDDLVINSSSESMDIYSPGRQQIMRISVDTGHFEHLYDVSGLADVEAFVNAPSHQRFYVALEDNQIGFFDSAGEYQNFVKLYEKLDSMMVIESFLVITVDSNIVVYDINGIPKGSNFWEGELKSYLWDAESSKLMALSRYHRSMYYYSFIFDVNSGELGLQSYDYLDSFWEFDGSFFAMPGYDDVLFVGGKLYDASSLERLNSWNKQAPFAAEVTAQNELLLMHSHADKTKLERYSPDLKKLEEPVFSGAPQKLAVSDSSTLLLTQELNHLSLHHYELKSDIDGDGIGNLEDAFPSDPAASVDTDRDGYPDSWNEGYTVADSTATLVIDAFPQNTSCWLPEHADGAGNCDYGATVPAYIPDQVVAGNDSVLYMLSAEHGRVFRWSVDAQHYIKPILLPKQGLRDAQATTIAVSDSQQRLYVGYDSGEISFFDLDDMTSGVQKYYLSDLGVTKLVAAGAFVVASESTDNRNRATYHVLDVNGNLTDTKQRSRQVSDLLWSDVHGAIYEVSSTQLNYWFIDQSTGRFSAPVWSTHDLYGGWGLLSPDQNYLLLSDGRVVDATDLTTNRNLGNIEMAAWLPDDEIVKFVRADATVSLQRISRFDRLVDTASIEGNLVTVKQFGSQLVILTSVAGELQFTLYTSSNDTDGDGVNNNHDAFPMDIAASVDSDNDGYPDRWNDGYTAQDSTTGLSLDAFPDDATCWLTSHDDGTGSCDYSATMPAFSPDGVFADANGYIYSFSIEHNRIFVWSTTQEQYIAPILLTGGHALSVVYSQAHDRLYIAYEKGKVTFIDMSGNRDEQDFTHIDGDIQQLMSVGEFLLVSTRLDFIYDANGRQLDSRGGYIFPINMAWDNVNHRLFRIGDGNYPDDLYSVEVDQITGQFNNAMESPYHNDYSLYGPIRVSPDGNLVLLGSGNYFSTDDLIWRGSTATFGNAQWLSNNALLFASQDESRIALKRINLQNQVIEELSLNGELVSLTKAGDNIYIVSQVDEALVYTLFVANDDTDGDGVPNLEDAFPLDVAASVDSDLDGYPDSWNQGYTQADSTTDLVLDAFPQDSACWLASHDDGDGQCDYRATMPNFSTAQIASDVNGTIYLFSAEHRTVFTWSAETQQYSNPIRLGSAGETAGSSPRRMAYSEAHERLYFGYDSGHITFVNLAGDRSEQSFYKLPLSVGGLAAVGNFVLAQDSSGAWNTHYILDVNGILTDSRDWNHYSHEYAWNTVNNRVYFFSNDSSVTGLHFEEIDQVNGTITAQGESPYYNFHVGTGPIRVINAGTQVLLGSGAVYNAESLEREIGLQTGVEDAQGYGELLVTATRNDDSWFVNLLSYDDFGVFNVFERANPIVSIQLVRDSIIVIERVGDELTLSSIPFSDNDGDLLPAWWENLYGSSDSDAEDAGLDADGDGLSNLQEYLQGTDPTNTDTDGDGLIDFEEVNTHNTSPVVADTDGLSDGVEVNEHGTEPLLTDTDGDGFSDGIEVLFYETDPTDANSVPEAISVLSESFEGQLSDVWQNVEGSDASWLVNSDQASDGEFSLKSGEIGDSQSSSVQFSGLFAAGRLSFDARVSSESCCDMLDVLVDGEVIVTISSADRGSYSLELNDGEHVIEWHYYKDSSVSSGDDAAYIDNVTFEQ